MKLVAHDNVEHGTLWLLGLSLIMLDCLCGQICWAPLLSELWHELMIPLDTVVSRDTIMIYIQYALYYHYLQNLFWGVSPSLWVLHLTSPFIALFPASHHFVSYCLDLRKFGLTSSTHLPPNGISIQIAFLAFWSGFREGRAQWGWSYCNFLSNHI